MWHYCTLLAVFKTVLHCVALCCSGAFGNVYVQMGTYISFTVKPVAETNTNELNITLFNQIMYLFIYYRTFPRTTQLTVG